MSLVDIDPEKITVRDLWIPMPDGARLRGRLWLPVDLPPGGVPVLLEYLPYRLDDWTSVRDSERHPYYAANGYASVRVDIRGTGGSDGLFEDEYSPAELDDGVHLVHWLAQQPWSSGKVGMFGISWGGFNSLQIAERAPEPLRAIVTVCSSDDRFTNDVHYLGGAVLGVDMSAWAGTMLAFASRPPRADVVGEDWLEQWRDRLEGQQPLIQHWLAHQERDEYWRRGSVQENYGAISAAVLAVGGWADPYRDTVFQLVENLSAPTKGIVGPWSHHYPDRDLAPGPAIGFLQETLRWWDFWLKDEDTGVLAEPDLRVWVNDPEEPATYIPERQGRWVGVNWDGKPDRQRWVLGSGPRLVNSPVSTGQDAGRYFPYGNAADLPPDQRAEDGRSEYVDIPVGDEPIELVGQASVQLRLSSSADRGNVIVRLCDVAPDGTSTLVTRGVLNLLKRYGMERSVPLVPAEDTDVTVPLAAAGYQFAPGHRIRVAISNRYWPWIWPHGVRDELTVDLAHSSLTLPLLAQDAVPVGFQEAEHARPITIGSPHRTGSTERSERVVRYDVACGEIVLEVDPGYGGTRLYPDGLTFLEEAAETYRIREGEPNSARASTRWRVELAKDTWSALVQTTSEITSDAENFYVTNQVVASATVDGVAKDVFSRDYQDVIPRTSA